MRAQAACMLALTIVGRRQHGAKQRKIKMNDGSGFSAERNII